MALLVVWVGTVALTLSILPRSLQHSRHLSTNKLSSLSLPALFSVHVACLLSTSKQFFLHLRTCVNAYSSLTSPTNCLTVKRHVGGVMGT